MTDTRNSPELQEVDPDLMRRVAWGLLAGRTKAVIAAAEGISLAECRAYCTTPGMFASMNVWANVLERRHYCGTSTVKGLVDWAIDFMVENAADRLDRSAWWRVDQLVGPFMQYCFGLVVGWFIRYMDGVLGWRGAKRKHFWSWRQSYIDQLCWAVEIAIQQQMLDQQGEEYLTAADAIFRHAIADKEIFELGIGDELGVREALAGKRPGAVENPTADTAAPGAAAEADYEVAQESDAKLDHTEHFAPWLVGSSPTMTSGEPVGSSPAMKSGELAGSGPTMTSGELAGSGPTMTSGELAGSRPAVTTVDSGNSRTTLSWPAPEPAIHEGESTIAGVSIAPSWLWLVHAKREVEPIDRAHVDRILLYESIRFKRRRCRLPPVVRHWPIGRAA